MSILEQLIDIHGITKEQKRISEQTEKMLLERDIFGNKSQDTKMSEDFSVISYLIHTYGQDKLKKMVDIQVMFEKLTSGDIRGQYEVMKMIEEIVTTENKKGVVRNVSQTEEYCYECGELLCLDMLTLLRIQNEDLKNVPIVCAKCEKKYAQKIDDSYWNEKISAEYNKEFQEEIDKEFTAEFEKEIEEEYSDGF